MQKIRFKVWDEGWNGEDDPQEIEAIRPEYAAEKFVENNFSNLDYPSETDVWVLAPGGVKEKWTVTVESVPHFSAVKAE